MLSQQLKKALDDANNRLKARSCRIRIEVSGKHDNLSLRGTFPAIPGSGKIKPYQTRISLGYRALNLQLIKNAEKEAIKISLELEAGTFDWNDYLIPADTQPSGNTIASLNLKERVKERWWKGRDSNNHKSQTTWQTNYESYLRRFPDDLEVTPESICQWIEEYNNPPRSMRVFYVQVARLILKEMDLPTDCLKELQKGKVQRKPLNIRSLPSDAQIEEWRDRIPDLGWQYLYGLQAAYGLRNHECWKVDLSDFPVIKIGEDTKTGSRLVVPLKPGWAKLWALDKPVFPELDRDVKTHLTQ